MIETNNIPPGATHKSDFYGIVTFWAIREYKWLSESCRWLSCWHSWDEYTKTWIKAIDARSCKFVALNSRHDPRNMI